ncbi:MAG: DUF721 domain-containing protein [Actinomycetota bacterium]
MADDNPTPPDTDGLAVSPGPDLARALIARAKWSAKNAPKQTRSGNAGRQQSSYSSARTDDRDPQRVDDVLRRWVRDQGVEAEVGAGGLAALWTEIVGPDMADHVVPDGVTDTENGRELLLRAESTAWATQVRTLIPQISHRITQTLGVGIVDRIKVVGPAPPRRVTGTRRVPGPGPRDTYG